MAVTVAIAVAFNATGGVAFSWGDTNSSTGSGVEIENGQLVRSGELKFKKPA